MDRLGAPRRLNNRALLQDAYAGLGGAGADETFLAHA